MNRSDALAVVRRELTEKRYKHTLGVLETAVDLAKAFGEDEKQAELAAIFHDYAKFRPKEEMKAILLEQNFDDRLIQFNDELWHAPVGAFLVQQQVGVADEKVLAAIRFHTSGRANMSLLEKIIYVADYIEPGRNFPGVEEARRLAKVDIDQALLFAMKNTITFLISKGVQVFPETFEAYNDLVKRGVTL
ncbi:bis(5'-nucleosyl)-tetraphosphatase (symmetrical) YqeK [Bacillus sp. 2205SS5-2]|uniref:bis(5'-nucleosyl)-tetraphosphatase (symmetrical) YqeK n=1 Tax=Bacillus sp. 2205SS5-2 TaxID=3109031 RepID=UPI003006345A